MNALVENWRLGADRDSHVELSVVVPLYNEHEVITMMYQRLTTVLSELAISYELVLVDDGSRDGTPNVINLLAKSDPNITAVFLSRNFGKEAALTAGIAPAVGSAVILIDADLQYPPHLIPHILYPWNDGLNVLYLPR